MNVVAGTPVLATADGFDTGLVGTLGITIVDPLGINTVGRTTVGITEPGPGFYSYEFDAPTVPGAYVLTWDDGAGTFAYEDMLVMVAGSDINFGPCEAWISGADIAACCSIPIPDGSDAETVYGLAAFEASMALYEISGRQFSGLCTSKARPCSDETACWADDRLWAQWGSWLSYGGYAGLWVNEQGRFCGCEPLSQVKLAGYPIREIVEVRIDGEVLPALDENDNPNYRLDEHRYLVRMDDPGPPFAKRRWPGCQNLALNDTNKGTFSITYRHGMDPPSLGRSAAMELGCQIALSCAGLPCSLPKGVTRIVRQGVEIERKLLTGWFDPTQGTGLAAVDLFLRAYWKGRSGRRPAVWSPDVPQFARRES